MSTTWYGPPGQPCECPNLAGDCDGAHGTDDQAVPLPADAAIAGMLARRYSAQPTQRDLDVANIAAAAERERIRKLLGERFKEVLMQPGDGYLVDALTWTNVLAVLSPAFADEGDTDGQ